MESLAVESVETGSHATLTVGLLSLINKSMEQTTSWDVGGPQWSLLLDGCTAPLGNVSVVNFARVAVKVTGNCGPPVCNDHVESVLDRIRLLGDRLESDRTCWGPGPLPADLTRPRCRCHQSSEEGTGTHRGRQFLAENHPEHRIGPPPDGQKGVHGDHP